MAHMKPELWYGGMWVCEDSHGESHRFPEDYFTQRQAADQCGLKDRADVLYEKGWWVRLSAPGYTDQTDWDGPFKSRKLAERFIFSHYDVDAEGDDRKEGWEMDDDLDDDDSVHGLEQAPSNRKVYNLYETHTGRWVFRYGPTPFRFQDEEMFFDSRKEAVLVASKHGWVVLDNNRMRRAHTGGVNGT